MKKHRTQDDRQFSRLQNNTSSSSSPEKTPLQTMADHSPQVQQAAQLQSMADQSPQVQQAAQLQSMADQHTANSENAPAQLKISYESGRFGSREHLVSGLRDIFPEEAYDLIEEYVSKYEAAGGRAMFGSQVYDFIIDYLKKAGFAPDFAKTTETNDSEHGPMVPDKISRHDAPNAERAMAAFNHPQVTMGRMTLMDGRNKVTFQDRNARGHVHAEDQLLEQLIAFVQANQIDTRGFKLNLTINNFFCSETNTGKRDKSTNCLDEMIELQERMLFERFHVYFKNPYGRPEEMTASIEKLKAAGILVSSFTTTDDPPYANEALDPHSDDEEEDDDDEAM